MSLELDKPTRSQSRLRLMRNTSGKSEDDEKPIETRELSSPSNEDSLADFKSPKLNAKVFQNDSIRIIKDTSAKKIKPGKKKHGKNKISGDSRKGGKPSGNEQSIESLFFKVQSEKSTFTCPLCLKVFSDSNNQSIHTKSCAVKNNVSTRKLLAAVELQERQKEERRSIGLPAGPFITNAKKKSNPVKRLPQNDADIELAMALSLSLREVEKIEEFEEAVAVAAGSNEKILEMSSSQRKSTLQSFGFSTNKPVNEAFNNITKRRRRKPLGPTVLQSRTQEARDRILTERISEVLVGSESITQQTLAEKELSIGKNRKFVGVQNEGLNKWYKKSMDLWTRSQENCGVASYYVQELSKFIIPDNPTISDKIGDEEEVRKVDVIEIEEDDEEIKEIEEKAIVQETNETTKIKEPINFNNCLKNNWSQMVNNSHLSDVGIFPKDNNLIYAHNLVLWTRCQLLTNDYQISNQSEDQKKGIQYEIHWPHIDRNAAIIFLHYVYCAEISPDVFNDQKIRDQVKLLSEKYQIIELSEFLRDCDHEKIENNEDNHVIEEKIDNRSLNDSPDLFDDTEKFESLRETSITSLSSDNDKENEVEPSIIPEKPEIYISFEENLDNDANEEENVSNITDPEIITKKTKSNLSIFIDKVNRQQARGLLESDTDGDTPSKNQVIHKKNPFKIRGDSDDSLYSRKRKEFNKSGVSEPISNPQNVKTPLTVLEEEIRARVLKNQLAAVQEDSLTLNSQDSVDSIDESMYTKYIKRKRENSISEYRDALKCLNDSEHVNDQLNASIASESPILSSTFHNLNEECEEHVEAVGSGDFFDSDFDLPNSFGISKENGAIEDDNIIEKDADSSSTPKPNDNDDNNAESTSEKIAIVSGELFDSDFEISNPLEVSGENKTTQDNDNEVQENFVNLTQSKSDRVIIVSSSEDEHCNSSQIKRPQEDNLSSWEIPEGELIKSKSFNKELVSPRVEINSSLQKRGRSLSTRKIHDISNNSDEADSPLKKSPIKNLRNSQNPLKRPRVSSSFQISYNLTPPRDYDRMESPELNEELNKYGLKPQIRHRAVQLLQHIYNELHPSVPADMEVFQGLSLANSENEEPPCKKRLNSDDLERSFSDKDSDEEIKTQVPEDITCLSQNSLEDIKQAFHELLKSDKQIFNKILTYEPLPLESLYENLINQGFKGKINEVISFLDEQCITFQVLELKNKNRKKKKKEKALKQLDL